MIAIASQLAQVRPGAGTETALTASLPTEVTRIVVCNTTGVATTFSLYHDDDGTTYNADSQLYNAEPLGANETKTIEASAMGGGISVAEGGSIGVAAGTANAVNFTLYGASARVIGQ